jgi:hypothetical protein
VKPYIARILSNTASTDATGRVRFDQLDSGHFLVFATEPFTGEIERPPISLTIDDVGIAAAATVTIPSRLAIHGRVLDEQGRPLADEPVSLSSMHPGAWFFAELRSDHEGRFSIRGLAEGDYSIDVANMDWFNPVGGADSPYHRVVKAGTDDVEFRLPRVERETIRGTVRDVHGVPIAFAHIYVLLAPQLWTSVMSRSGGRFALDVPKGAKVQLFAGPRNENLQFDARGFDHPNVIEADASKELDVTYLE